MTRRLALLVHGINADAGPFWGSTRSDLEFHPSLAGRVRVQTWAYSTTSAPRSTLRRALAPLLGSGRLQTLAQLGEHLWHDLRFVEADEVLLFGHSMGGLVSVAALAHGLRGCGDLGIDADLLAKIKGVGLCATPLGGADLARKLGLLFRVFGKNVQVSDLRPDSASRRSLVNEFINRALRPDRAIPVRIFRASDDSVVAQDELFEPFGEPLRRRLQADCAVLTGEHSACVQNVGVETTNARTLRAWIADGFGIAPPKATAAAPRSRRAAAVGAEPLRERIADLLRYADPTVLGDFEFRFGIDSDKLPDPTASPSFFRRHLQRELERNRGRWDQMARWLEERVGGTAVQADESSEEP